MLPCEQRKAGPGWHGMVEYQQIGATLSTKAGGQVGGVCADAHVEHALGVEGLVQEDLVRWASLVNQHIGLVHMPLLVGGPANVGVELDSPNRKFLRLSTEKSEILGPRCGPRTQRSYSGLPRLPCWLTKP